ncbi:MAG: ExbD/TolR family protein [Terriglobia bacterium]
MAFTSNKGTTQTSLSDINITPFVDVMLVLLVIFMLTAPILQSGIEVSLPKTHTVKIVKSEKVVVTIDKQQTVYVGNNPVNIHQLGSIIDQKLNGDTNSPVYIRADQAVPFGTFAEVMDVLKQAQITNVSVVTQPIRTKRGAQ